MLKIHVFDSILAPLKLAFIAVFASILFQTGSVAASDHMGQEVWLTAHRGDSERFPENTLSAFRSALDCPVDWIELDVFRTRDGVVVVTHDLQTRRVAEIDLKVSESTLAEVQALDVATGHRARHKLTLQECPVERMPTLAEVLDLVRSQDRVRVSIQPKMDCIAEIVEVVKKMSCEHLVGFNDGSLILMQKAKTALPDVPVFWDRGPQTDLDQDLMIARDSGFQALVLRHDGITREKVLKIKNAGFQAGAWTVNEADDLRRLFGLGVQRIYTDHPVRTHQNWIEWKQQIQDPN